MKASNYIILLGISLCLTSFFSSCTPVDAFTAQLEGKWNVTSLRQGNAELIDNGVQSQTYEFIQFDANRGDVIIETMQADSSMTTEKGEYVFGQGQGALEESTRILFVSFDGEDPVKTTVSIVPVSVGEPDQLMASFTEENVQTTVIASAVPE
ncbi:MAG: hypothetical protein AAFY71_01065 [Bacteroidota bacterium]